MWCCSFFDPRAVPDADDELELFRSGREFQEAKIGGRYLIDVQEGLCTDTRTSEVRPCWRQPPPDPAKSVVRPLLDAPEWRVTARPGMFTWHRLYAAFRPEWFDAGGGARLFAADVNAAIDPLLRGLGKGLGRDPWRTPALSHGARCVESGRRLGAHIPITDALAEADPELVSASNTEPAVFRFDPRSVMIARKHDCEVLCVRGSVEGTGGRQHKVCMMLGEFRLR